jgi:hypothetical protein
LNFTFALGKKTEVFKVSNYRLSLHIYHYQKIELSILDSPQDLCGYHLNLRDARTVADIAIENRGVGKQVDMTGFDRLLTTRETAFHAIHQQHQERQSNSKPEMCVGIVEICDLLAVEREILAYAEAFLLLSATVLKEPDGRTRAARIELLAHIDTIELRWHSNAADPGKGRLIGPTHPLRLLWHLQHARYRESTIEAVLQKLKKPWILPCCWKRSKIAFCRQICLRFCLITGDVRTSNKICSPRSGQYSYQRIKMVIGAMSA